MARVKREITKQREMDAWQLRLQGISQYEIAERLGCDQSTICVALKRVEKRLHAEFVEQVAEIKARQAAQLEEVYRKAMEQFERSCEEAERITVVSGRSKVGVSEGDSYVLALPDQVTTMREGQTGNPALLAQARGALADVRAIYGMDAPQKQEIAGTGGGPIAISEVVVEKSTRGE